MKLLYLTDYFYPFIHGGAETSVFEIARQLVKAKHQVIVLTPNYGAKSTESLDGINIQRYWFPTHLTTHSSQLTPLWHFNPLYWLLLGVSTAEVVRDEHVDIIHCQSITTIIPAVIIGKLLKKPVVLTFRDNQILCNYGWCLTKDQFGKACNLSNYFTSDFPHYYFDKVCSNNPLIFFLQLGLAIQGRFRVWLLRYFAKVSDVLVVASKAQQRTFKINGFTTKVIANFFSFGKIPTKSKAESKFILYATKLSPGKGLDILLNAFPTVLRSYPNMVLKVVGGGDQKKYLQQCKQLGIAHSVHFVGRINYQGTMRIRQRSLLEITPSVYPESFGRSALEALACGVPVISSNRGGLTDIVEDKVTGYIVNPVAKELSAGIIQGIKRNVTLRRNIVKRYEVLTLQFSTLPVTKHITLYKSLV